MRLQLPPKLREQLFRAPTPGGGGFENFADHLKAKCDEKGMLEIDENEVAKVRQIARHGQSSWRSFFASLAGLISRLE